MLLRECHLYDSFSPHQPNQVIPSFATTFAVNVTDILQFVGCLIGNYSFSGLEYFAPKCSTAEPACIKNELAVTTTKEH